MFDLTLLGAWTEFALRGLHVTAAIAWIGTSFYIMALDLRLTGAANQNTDQNTRQYDVQTPNQGVAGEEWHLHNGRIHHIRRFQDPPDRLPAALVWFKWESYWSWASGFALLTAVYYVGAEFYLIDPITRDLTVWQAVTISVLSLILGWVVYDLLCKALAAPRQTRQTRVTHLILALFALLVGMAWFYGQVFSGRAALLHLGALAATIMTANVAHVIVPQQRRLVADLAAGRRPDAGEDRRARQRAAHNSYLTLPVIFLMLSNHAPLAYGTAHSWVIACLIFLLGVAIRHYIHGLHRGKGHQRWIWGLGLGLVAAIIALSAAPLARSDADQDARIGGQAARFAQTDTFDAAYEVVLRRCAMCHAQAPGWPGLHGAPKGILLETEAQVARHAKAIFLYAGLSQAMPPGNLAGMQAQERALIRGWYAAGRMAEGPWGQDGRD